MDVPAAVPRFPWWWLLAAPVVATAWTAAALGNNNLEAQSIDLVHHVMYVDHLGTPWGAADQAHVQSYPLASHRVAAAWMPLFHDPIRSIRAAELTSLLVMLVAQWGLLRAVLPGGPAALVLVGWQVLCTSCKLGDVNHFMWDYQFNYSRAVSAAALWTMLLSFVVPPFLARFRIANFAVALALAAFAFRCHIAAGSLALATLGAWCAANLAARNWLVGLGGGTALAAVGAGLLAFTHEWRTLAGQQHDNALLPVKHADLIRLWMPTAIAGAIYAGYRLARARREPLVPGPATAVLCGLLPAAALQAYMLYGKNVRGTIGTYPYNQMLFYTFALASLLWVVLLAGLGRRLAARLGEGTRLCAEWAANALAGAAIVWGAWTTVKVDARRPWFGPDRDPAAVADRLKPLRAAFAGHYYYDPEQRHGSYYVTRAVLTADCPDASRYWLHTHTNDLPGLLREPGLRGLFLPLAVDPVAVVGPGCPTELVGPFRRVDLAAYRAGPGFSPSAGAAAGEGNR